MHATTKECNDALADYERKFGRQARADLVDPLCDGRTVEQLSGAERDVLQLACLAPDQHAPDELAPFADGSARSERRALSAEQIFARFNSRQNLGNRHD